MLFCPPVRWLLEFTLRFYVSFADVRNPRIGPTAVRISHITLFAVKINVKTCIHGGARIGNPGPKGSNLEVWDRSLRHRVYDFVSPWRGSVRTHNHGGACLRLFFRCGVSSNDIGRHGHFQPGFAVQTLLRMGYCECPQPPNGHSRFRTVQTVKIDIPARRLRPPENPASMPPNICTFHSDESMHHSTFFLARSGARFIVDGVLNMI